MSVRGRLAVAIGAGLLLTLGGGAATAAPTATPQLHRLLGNPDTTSPDEICNLYQSPNNTRASICSVASFPSGGVVNGYYRGTRAGIDGWVEIRINTTVQQIDVPSDGDFYGIWTDASSVQFRVCGVTGGCGPWK